jgi:hypothetical protein
MAKTQPGGLYLAPDGKTFHDAWNRPVEEGVNTFNPPPVAAHQPLAAGTQPVGGQLDTPFPGSDQYRAHEERARQQAEALQKEADRLAKEAEKLRESLKFPVDLANLQLAIASLSRAGTPRSAAGAGEFGLTRDEIDKQGEAWVKSQEQMLEKTREHSLAVSTDDQTEKGLEEGGQTEGASDNEPSQVEKDAARQGRKSKQNKDEEK